jgi:hypothetical protein
MGKLRLGTKLSHKHTVRRANEWKEQAEQAKAVTQQALLYNAGLHRSLQHELCVCGHGASKHLPHPEYQDAEVQACHEINCECKLFKSNWQQAFENWTAEAWAYCLSNHGLDQTKLPPVTDPTDPMHPVKLTEAFDGGVKAEKQAEEKAKWELAMTENAEEASKGEANA